MGYLIAAYSLVIVTLAVYGLRVQAQRRALMRREAPGAESREAGGGPA
jgi:hypothetical protein